MKEKELILPSVELLEKELQREQRRNRRRRVLRGTILTLLLLAAAGVIAALLILPVYRVSGDAMSQTLKDGNVVIALNNGKYKSGDVISFYSHNSISIKRVIAVAGDRVDIDAAGNVFVNGRQLDEPYVSGKALGYCNIELPCQVPDGSCFVMGDHRAGSVDSRNSGVGCISNEKVVGRLLLRVWPFERIGIVR